MQKGRQWEWTNEHRKLFYKAKNLLLQSSVLTHYDPKNELVVAADTSPIGVGGVLSHVMEGGSERPIAFVSRSLTSAERNYSQLDFRYSLCLEEIPFGSSGLYGHNFRIYSDHQPLKHLFDKNRQIPNLASARIQRWALLLAAYSYTIRYCSGKAMANTDALSRLPLPKTTDDAPEPGDHVALANHLE